ncbi:SMI1/KNR4 family protein [Streptomyces murinus]|uniref:SMI1/KNR4 family protein n=1 Tax=Streptomyces murinus TaxID=33900 RepID=UPI00372D5934
MGHPRPCGLCRAALSRDRVLKGLLVQISRLHGLLGSGRGIHASAGAWEQLEGELGVVLPGDYKQVVDGYGPVQINGHLFLSHPATRSWNLGAWMKSTVDAFSASDLSDARCPGFPHGPVFGAPAGLIPLVDTDRGEYAFGVVDEADGTWRILACNGDEQDFYEYRMPFAEWLYRYLTGEDMFGPGSAVFYPGPVVFEPMPMAAGDEP